MCTFSKHTKPSVNFEPRPFIAQGKVSFDVPNSIVYERKFDTAIRSSHIKAHYDRVKNEEGKTLDDLLIMNSKNYPEFGTDIDQASASVAYMMKERFDALVEKEVTKANDNSQRKRVSRIMTLIRSNLSFQCEYLNKQNNLPNLKFSRKRMRAMFDACSKDLNYIAGLVDLSDWLLGVINQSNIMYAEYYQEQNDEKYITEITKINHLIYKPSGMEISWSHNFMILKLNPQKVFLLPKVYMLLLHNKICDLLSIILYTRYAQFSSLPEKAYDTVLTFCYELWELNIEYGQKFFNIAKCLEGLATAESLKDVEEWDNSEFLTRIVNDIRKDTGFNYTSSNIAKIMRKSDIPFRHELAALSKISGHPFVDMEEGAYSLHKYTTETYTLDIEKLQQCMCFVKQNYVRNHIFREKKWPPIEPIPIEAPEGLRVAHLRGLDPEGETIQRKYGKIDILAYEHVELKQNLRFLKLENAIPYLKDKTISILRSDVVKKYINNEDIRCEWKNTRLLLFYLMHSGEETDHVEFINAYAGTADFEEFLNYLIIRIVPKEKELKVAFRGFGCTTFQNRMLFLAQEKTAMHYLDLYSDEQAMTLSELDLVKRLFTFRNLKKAYPRHRIINIMIDASKWNNHFRPESVDYIMAQTLDPIHGTSIFGKTQKKYENTMFYVPDDPTTFYWEGQSGGIEGLNQDTWVITYIAQIKTALYGLDLRYHILCKGDDLRIAIIIPEHDPRSKNIQETKNTIMTRVSEAAKGLGHEIKVYDSYGSEHYFNFSKSASVDNVELPQVFRKIQKCYGASNAFLPTFDEFIGSTFSNAHSACRVTTNFVPCYGVALFWTYYYLTSDKPSMKKELQPQHIEDPYHQHKYYTFVDCSDDELVALTLIPSILGGFPIIYLHNMMVRAESDLLPPFIDMYQFAQERRLTEIVQVMKEFLKFPHLKPDSWRAVYKDPYCLPVNKPTSPSQYLRQQIVPALDRVTKAEDIRDLLDAARDDDVSKRYILSMDRSIICHAKVFSVIYSAFPEAVLEEFILKFESARSVLELLILRSRKRRALNILRHLVRLERNCSQWKLRKLKGVLDETLYDYSKLITPCPAESAQKIRDHAWFKPIDGITMPPLSHLLFFTTPFAHSGDEHCRRNHFLYNFDYPEYYITNYPSHHFAVGKRLPFIGHITGTGTLNPTLHMVEKDAILTKLRNIAELVSWTDVQEITADGEVRVSNLRLLVEGVIKMYTDMPLDVLAPFTGSRKSGTIAHHIRLRHFREAVMPNSLSNVYQCCIGESNTHSKFHADRGHYWINFLQCHSHAVCISTFELNFSPLYSTPNEVWSVTINCDYCLRDVYEPAVVIDPSCIRNTAFPELLATRLSQQAKQVLKESLCLARGRRYNQTGHDLDLTPEIATTGIFQMLCDMSVSNAQRLADMYTHHPSTREGYNILRNFTAATQRRIIGQREIMNMDDETLTKCVIYTIVSLVSEYFVLRQLGDIELAMKTFPSYTLPWHTLLYELHRVGRLGILVENLAKKAKTQPIGLIITPDAVAPFVGVLCYKSLFFMNDPIPFIVLSDYEVENIYHLLRRQMFRVLWLEINSKLSPEEIRGQNQISVQLTIMAYAFLLSCEYQMRSTALEENYELQIENSMLLICSIMLPCFDDMDKAREDAFILEETDFEAAQLCIKSFFHKNYSIFIKLILKNSKTFDNISFEDIIKTSIENYDELQNRIMEIFNKLMVFLTYTTAQACIETIRRCPNVFSRYSLDRVPTEDSWIPMANYFKPILPKPEQLIYRCPKIDLLDQSHNVNYYNHNNPSWKTRIVNPKYLTRCYGNSNDTMNKLVDIFYQFDYSLNKDVSCLRISCMGDGIGNGTTFLAHLHPKSQFVFTTKPQTQMHHVRSLMAEDIITEKGSVCLSEHNLQGCWDLGAEHVTNFLEATYGMQHLYFCDAEPEPGEVDFHYVYRNVINYYLKTRGKLSLLIMQVSSSNFAELAKCLVILRLSSEDVYLIQPQSERCYYGQYIVCWNKIKEYDTIDWDSVNVTSGVYASLTRYLDKILTHHQSIHLEKPRQIHLLNLPKKNTFWMYKLPALWISYIRKELNIFISDEELDSLTRVKTLTELDQINPVRDSIRSKLMSTLKSHGQDILFRNQAYNMNTRSHRVSLCALYFYWAGWKCTWKRSVTRAKMTIPETYYRTEFYTACTALPLRDFNPDIQYTGIYTNHMKDEENYELPYWKWFANGAEACLSFLGWISCWSPGLFKRYK